LNARSLRLRLLLGAALWVTLALMLAGAAIAYLFIANVERAVRADLSAGLSRLVAEIDPQAPSILGSAEPLSDPRYRIPLSGVYWQVENTGSGALVRSRSLWDSVLKTSAPDGSGETFSTIEGPGGQSLSALSLLARFNTADGAKTFRIAIAQDRTVLDQSISQFGRELAIALLILGAALVFAAWLQVRLGLKPLSKLRDGIEAIRRGAGDRVPGSYPLEVMPLVAEVDEMLAWQRKSIEFARARASDLAHGLKTPLSVLGTLSGRIRESGDGETAELIEELADEMADRIDYQLRLSRLRVRTRSHALNASLDQALGRTVSVMRKTRDGEKLRWEIEMEEALVLDIDPHDLLELVGVLLENAAKWGKSLVHVDARRADGHVRIRIADDGPGLGEAELSRLGVRGRRLDETVPGSGLGLAIAGEIVALNDGTMSFARAQEGGVEVTVCLPFARG
jgi:signal transduction histidine kinase